MERGLEWMLGFSQSSAVFLRIGKRFPALLAALFRALDEDGDGRINVEAGELQCKSEWLASLLELNARSLRRHLSLTGLMDRGLLLTGTTPARADATQGDGASCLHGLGAWSGGKQPADDFTATGTAPRTRKLRGPRGLRPASSHWAKMYISIPSMAGSPASSLALSAEKSCAGWSLAMIHSLHAMSENCWLGLHRP